MTEQNTDDQFEAFSFKANSRYYSNKLVYLNEDKRAQALFHKPSSWETIPEHWRVIHNGRSYFDNSCDDLTEGLYRFKGWFDVATGRRGVSYGPMLIMEAHGPGHGNSLLMGHAFHESEDGSTWYVNRMLDDLLDEL